MGRATFLLSILCLLLSLLRPSASQRSPAAAQPANITSCNGIFLNYQFQTRVKIHPFVSNPADQPYAFAANVTILNSGTIDLETWVLVLGFSHREILVSISNAVLSDGSDLPFASDPKTPVAFSGFPNPDLKTAIATAGDLSQIQTSVSITGTQFGVAPPAIPLPSSISLSDPAWSCPPSAIAKSNTSVFTCCVPNLDPLTNSTIDNSTLASDQNFLPPRSGDLSITYDIVQAYPSSYLALVTIDNKSPLGRLDNWRISWEWMRGEFIYSIKGAYTSLLSSSDCIYGKQGQYYQDLDFSKVINCQKKPIILDLPSSMAKDNIAGNVPFCCRNGTILPESMDPSQTKSAFQVQVFKMPPDLNRTVINPPQNWRITGALLNPDYLCGAPIRLAPSNFPDPSGLQSNSTAIATWQVVCNITQPKNSKPKCCVSFSSYYNESAIPCRTCACGCPSKLPRTCNSTAPALLLPADALLVPFDNRSAKAKAWAEIKHFPLPDPMPCGDFCGVSINWHINSDYSKGWTGRVTLFNWEEVSFANWFMAVEMPKAYDGFESMYSFNGTAIGNDTIFMQGLPGLNYLMGEVDGSNPATDPRVPGKQQSVISFTKSQTPGINVPSGDGFPSKLYFNGEECSLPDTIPTGGASRSVGGGCVSVVFVLFATVLVFWGQ